MPSFDIYDSITKLLISAQGKDTRATNCKCMAKGPFFMYLFFGFDFDELTFYNLPTW